MTQKEPVVTHDKEFGTIYIKFRDGKIAGESEEINLIGGISVFIDRNKSGKIVGIEIIY